MELIGDLGALCAGDRVIDTLYFSLRVQETVLVFGSRLINHMGLLDKDTAIKRSQPLIPSCFAHGTRFELRPDWKHDTSSAALLTAHGHRISFLLHGFKEGRR